MTDDDPIEVDSYHPDDEALTQPVAGGRSSRRSRRNTLIAAGAAGLVLIGGGIAVATTSSASAASWAAGYGAPGYGAPGYGQRPSGAPTGARPTGAPTGARTPHLAGTVKSVSGSTILITDQDGFTRTIKVSSSTKYEDSLTANPAVGTKIAAEGTVDANGTTLDATVVTAPKGPGDGGGGPGGGRPGGGPGNGGGAGSGSGAAKPTATAS